MWQSGSVVVTQSIDWTMQAPVRPRSSLAADRDLYFSSMAIAPDSTTHISIDMPLPLTVESSVAGLSFHEHTGRWHAILRPSRQGTEDGASPCHRDHLFGRKYSRMWLSLHRCIVGRSIQDDTRGFSVGQQVRLIWPCCAPSDVKGHSCTISLGPEDGFSKKESGEFDGETVAEAVVRTGGAIMFRKYGTVNKIKLAVRDEIEILKSMSHVSCIY
ncbi:hypothetical protein BDZ85DRAFT_57649 [Elsinoe ampelina]|uniref:Uncharacterized protein n=1 Tax=Elsinoe ampelina TaxID=302913 RepID=A0A6A6GMS7_9PEZI|nr:hypothetical protein BDZ85DRAFT_57649 [Elsinoe ampelina]